MSLTVTELAARFSDWGIHYRECQHPPLQTCRDADTLSLQRPGQRLKHLFLRDNYGRRHFLLITAYDKRVDLKQLSRQLSVARLGFASPERLRRYLGVAPGCVSVLALCNDPAHHVELLIDAQIWSGEAFQCHPLVNTSTWIIEQEDIDKLLQHTAHQSVVLTVPILACV